MDYKKTLEDIVKIINTTEKCDDGFVNICNYIYENCPELSESKDDRIRKGLIALLKFGLEDGSAIAPGFNETKEEALTWLEKQAKLDNNDTDILNRFSFYSYKDEPNVIYLSELYVNKEHRNKGIGTKILEIADKVAASMGCNFIRLKTEIGSYAEGLYRRNGYYAIKIEDNQVWLEKQNEQKSSIKVKPKFQEGDWIVNNNCGGVYQVTEIRDNEYCLWPLDTEIMGYLRTIDVDNEYHLWTIQDAKDGDILSDGTMIVIFKCIKEPAYSEHIVAYVGLDTFGNIQITDGTWEFGKDKIYPATKEQCDLLFKKMKEVGCKFNDETKKLETL